MHWCLRRIGLLAVTVFVACQALAATPVLRLGIMPSGAPAAVLKQYTSLEHYLERELGVKVHLESAPDFASFLRRVMADDYDIVGLAPHLALFAASRGHWLPLVSADYGIKPTLISRESTGIATIADLRGRRVAVPDSLALITLQAELELQRASLEPGQTMELVHAPNHASVMEMVRRGLADAGFVSSVLLERQPPERREGLTVVRYFSGMFSFAYMASSRLPPRERERLQAALLRFPATPEGRAFFSPLATVAVRALTAVELEAFRSFQAQVERRLDLSEQ